MTQRTLEIPEDTALHRYDVQSARFEASHFYPANGDGREEKLRVLVIDDHRPTADTLTWLIELWGHDVRVAYDGATGLALVESFHPHVLLLDILMPGVSGIEVAMQVRRNPRFNECWLIAITGRTDARHRSRCYDAGVDVFLIKPVEPSFMEHLLELQCELMRCGNAPLVGTTSFERTNYVSARTKE